MRTMMGMTLILVGLASSPGAGWAQDPLAGAHPTLRFPGDSVSLAMHTVGGRSVVQVRIGPDGPFDFFIDTGSRTSVIDRELAARLQLEVVGSTRAGAPGGAGVDVDVVSAPLLQVANLEILESSAIALDLAELTGGVMDGILGMDLFRDVLLSLEPSRGAAVVSRRRLRSDAPGVVTLSDAPGPLTFDVDVAGRTIPAHLDTGAPHAFTLPLDLMDEVATLDGPTRRATARLVGSERELLGRQLDGAVRFAGLTFENPWIMFLSPSAPVANVGSEVLDGLRIEIDQSSGLVALTPVGQIPATPASPRRLGLRLGGQGGDVSNVAGVDPGSLAEQAGLRAGDKIVLLNGQPLAEYGQDLGALFRGTTPLVFEVDRQGERVVLRIP